MDKQKLCQYVNLYAPPVLVILAGLILIFSPDSASALVSCVLGWGAFLLGIVWGLMLLGAHARLRQFVGAAVCILLGLWLVNDPLALARSLGRLVGLLIIVRSVQELTRSVRVEGKIVSGIMLAMGVFLLLVPMTTSRLAMIPLGIVVVITGVGMLLERLRNKGNWLDSGDDPNIIDAL